MRTTVLVEGRSDEVALRALARAWGRSLADEDVDVLPMGGITHIRAVATRLHVSGHRLAGLYDAPEVGFVRRGLTAAGVLEAEDAELEPCGFFCCERDLEDELRRALGTARVEQVIEAAGETRSLEMLAQMPAQAGWTREDLLARFMTSRSGRKERYARLLVEAMPRGSEPAPLRALLAHLGVRPIT
ncbi:TOPRIM nucleotidyl transferase/hydrolase domain-containing protein [Nocardioides hwasunensis]|uniref:ATP-dependent endonuclease n=1 Tax=Nocardioides hwasunensis TaxID=397258 RepID=A0ABR8MJ02_9ACTN|nr:TOPRIM nucleotidyl transferase/hydrolase domain-containing protein [Nocardioides hwasunensis]MBD3914074.1 ATP-dependent endonuclease [Nocardioides hwasunensis]